MQISKVYDLLDKNHYIIPVYRNKVKPIDRKKRKYKVNKYKNRWKLSGLYNNSGIVIYTFRYLNFNVGEDILFHFYKCYKEYSISNNIKISKRMEDNINRYNIS